MSIRTKNKDNLKPGVGSVPSLDTEVSQPLSGVNKLYFTTQHEKKPGLVDLTQFRSGRIKQVSGPKWGGAFTGRPELIDELAPAIYDAWWLSPSTTTAKFIKSIRNWWRLFDAIEARAANAGHTLPALTSVAQLTELHGQAALDAGLDSNTITDFRRVVNLTRRALGLREVHWPGPERRDPKRHLPSADKMKFVWNALKRQWLETLDRWDRAMQILEGNVETEHERRLQVNYLRFQSALIQAEHQGRSFPTPSEIRGQLTHLQFSRLGLQLRIAYGGFLPTPKDVRMAFHLCLASTGWNAQVMLDLAVEPGESEFEKRAPFLEVHPRDPSRYILRGQKNRGGTEQVVYGDWKTSRGPGYILRTLIDRTWPLRQVLMAQLKIAEVEYEDVKLKGAPDSELDQVRVLLAKLRQGTRSPWLYCTANGEIAWLSEHNYRALPGGTIGGNVPVMSWLVDQANASNHLEGPDRIPYIVAGDFRDAFAAFVWKATGGSVLHVMQALGHRRLKTTFIYLNNTVVNEASVRVYRTFSNVMWDELRSSGRIDPTILAKLTRDARATSDERERLETYRSLKRSRIGVGCLDPLNPPSSVAPDFVPNGKSQCPVQRCMLCLEHAVVLPESLDKLAMRLVELDWLRERMAVDAFVAREFQLEYDNTNAALALFDVESANDAKAHWLVQVKTGQHRVIEFQGGMARISR